MRLKRPWPGCWAPAAKRESAIAVKAPVLCRHTRSRSGFRGGLVLIVPIVLVVLSLAGGCALPPPVKPWQKEHLARPEMSLDVGAPDLRYSDHVYVSREGSAGGSGIGGGGCGCN